MEVLGDYFSKGPLLVIADFFSIITVASCLFIKVPQIKTIKSNQSSEGISAVGLSLELYSYSIMMSYNYHSGYDFLSYMEYPVLLLQEYVLVYYVFKYKNLLGRNTLIVTIFYIIFAFSVYIRLFPLVVLTILVPFCTPIGAMSKLMQLLTILKTKDSRSVSLTTWALSTFTNLTRVYTVFVQAFDIMLLLNFVTSVMLSFSVFLAASYYKKPKAA